MEALRKYMVGPLGSKLEALPARLEEALGEHLDPPRVLHTKFNLNVDARGFLAPNIGAPEKPRLSTPSGAV